ncbi:glycosyltransferase family 4 protein [Spirochaeta isovalerica]|uniref:Glycosyltransferase involved in cell wall biosynthesis n=1 Tax=Spirochaeta isovalerica TaxID=150 RepID=A0A841R792_9SPIO|nr:glycosyltransferase family 4 protein [Spirochaeta isovalerica]MBB6478372.1 glycosyltransferase involved in cell wall biosynthesis [Spirochaeta isovalerica]
MSKNIGFISFRFAGTDGVSLETYKWDHVLTELGHKCFYMGGELDTPDEISYFHDELHFQHPEIRRLYSECFGLTNRPERLTKELHNRREAIKKHIYNFIKKFNIDLIIPQNTLTIPLNIPLGMALTEVIAESGIPVIAHHHDFFWERKRFLRNCVWDYINSCYPPHLPNIKHVVINSSAGNQLALRTGISSTLIPNVMHFEQEPDPVDEYSSDVREALGIENDELLVLQPTRVVQRKGIEHALELVARLNMKATLVISHASGDEGYEYQQRVQEYAEMVGTKTLFVQDIIADKRGMTSDGRKIYTLEDIYPHADLVTYPSLVEGFGNAFLETLWFKKPILVNNYSIYSTDIKPKGFQVIEMDNFISSETIETTRKLMHDKDEVDRMAEVNYNLGLKYYSYGVVRQKLQTLLAEFFGTGDI